MTKVISLAGTVIKNLLTSSIAIYVYLMHIGLYLIGNSWKDNSSVLMNSMLLLNLGIALYAVLSAFKRRYQTAFKLIGLELVLFIAMLVEFSI